MTVKEKNMDKLYQCKNIKTAINRAIKEGIISFEEIDQETLTEWIKEVEENGQFREFWEDKESNTFFRFQIEQNEDYIYIDLGYKIKE